MWCYYACGVGHAFGMGAGVCCMLACLPEAGTHT